MAEQDERCTDCEQEFLFHGCRCVHCLKHMTPDDPAVSLRHRPECERAARRTLFGEALKNFYDGWAATRAEREKAGWYANDGEGIRKSFEARYAQDERAPAPAPAPIEKIAEELGTWNMVGAAFTCQADWIEKRNARALEALAILRRHIPTSKDEATHE